MISLIQLTVLSNFSYPADQGKLNSIHSNQIFSWKNKTTEKKSVFSSYIGLTKSNKAKNLKLNVKLQDRELLLTILLSFFKSEMVEGIGPSMDVPWKSLQNKYTIFRNTEGKGKRNSICRSTGVDKWNEENTHNLSMLVQFPIKLGIFPDSSLPSILLQQRKILMNTSAKKTDWY